MGLLCGNVCEWRCDMVLMMNMLVCDTMMAKPIAFQRIFELLL